MEGSNEVNITNDSNELKHNYEVLWSCGVDSNAQQRYFGAEYKSLNSRCGDALRGIFLSCVHHVLAQQDPMGNASKVLCHVVLIFSGHVMQGDATCHYLP
jgi:hypothetical protein